jgi:hypothetical protein
VVIYEDEEGRSHKVVQDFDDGSSKRQRRQKSREGEGSQKQNARSQSREGEASDKAK